MVRSIFIISIHAVVNSNIKHTRSVGSRGAFPTDYVEFIPLPAAAASSATTGSSNNNKSASAFDNFNAIHTFLLYFN